MEVDMRVIINWGKSMDRVVSSGQMVRATKESSVIMISKVR
jgi:hypothetical protein